MPISFARRAVALFELLSIEDDSSAVGVQQTESTSISLVCPLPSTPAMPRSHPAHTSKSISSVARRDSDLKTLSKIG
ncbi:MAG: hypothetical protein IPM55_22930 [Acidobacteria bacterium]|nr:hypothetical protein [Acidobacteriota bacterium]